MPELPEVETIRRGLAPRMTGSVIKGVEVLLPRLFKGDAATLTSAKITAVERQGKLLLLRLNDDRCITIHLKMTGQLLWQGKNHDDSVMGGHPEQGYIDTLPNTYTRVIFHFTNGSTLYFNDLRTFGFIHILTSEELRELPFLKKMGPEPDAPGFTAAYLAARLAKSPKSTIKSLLLDQSQIAGLGNIYVDESLFRAGIHPARPAASLNHDEIVTLVGCIKETIALALEYGGSSQKDYLNAIGEKGTYLKIAQVYHRNGQPCPRCPGHTIQKIKQGGRGTHFCANCQH